MLDCTLLWVVNSEDDYSSMNAYIAEILCQGILYFHNITIHWHKSGRYRSNFWHHMLAFYWDNIDSKSKELQGILQTITLASLLFIKCFGSINRGGNISDILCYSLHFSGLLLLLNIIHQWRINSQHYMLANPVFSQHYNSLIQISKRCNKQPLFYVSFPLKKSNSKIKKLQGIL